MTKARNIFFVVFALSTLIGCVLLWTSSRLILFPGAPASEDAPTPAPTSESGNQTVKPAEQPSAASSNLALVTSLLTSLASFVGFLTTTIITWRKERRESDLAAMERKKLELELEKNKLELEELKKKHK